jgi:hypothetical protein
VVSPIRTSDGSKNVSEFFAANSGRENSAKNRPSPKIRFIRILLHSEEVRRIRLKDFREILRGGEPNPSRSRLSSYTPRLDLSLRGLHADLSRLSFLKKSSIVHRAHPQYDKLRICKEITIGRANS